MCTFVAAKYTLFFLDCKLMKKLSTLLLVLMALLALPQVAHAADYDVEAANIAAFNAVEDGKIVKLTLANARVNAFNDLAATYYVEDASGATAIKGISLTKGTALNGYIVGKKGSEDIDFMNTPSQCIEPSLTVTDATLSSFEATATTLVGTPMTITDACAQANHGKLVTLNNISIEHIGNGKNWQLTDAAGNTMKTRDLFGVLPADYTWPEKASEMTGVLMYYMTGWFLIPISADMIVGTSAQVLSATFDFVNNNMNLAIGTATDVNAGNLGGKIVKMDGVTLSFVNAMTMPTRYYLNGNRGNQLQAIAGGMMRVTAPAGYAVVSIVSNGNKSVNEKTGAITYQNNWEIVKGGGAISAANQETQTWTGNAESVLLNAKGATYVETIVVTLAAANGETALLSEEAADSYTEVQGLIAFGDAANNSLVKLTLTDAIITSGMVNGWGYYVQDANAGAHFYCTALDFEVGDVLNGVVYVKKSNQNMGARICMTEATNAQGLTITKNGTVTPVEGTIAEVNVAANKCRVVKLTGVAVKGTKETEATITDAATNTITINNGKTNYYAYVIQESLADIDYNNATVTGILLGGSKENQIMPLSIVNGGTGIHEIASQKDEDIQIYNLQGVRLNKLQKGINIVNGKKVVIK